MMNKCYIIGNLTADPETQTTQNGVSMCRFTVAVSLRGKESQDDKTDFFRVTAWRQLGEICKQYLAKGRKVAVVGPVHAGAYIRQDGTAAGTLEINADDVEFLTPKQDGQANAPRQAPPLPKPDSGFVQVDDEELPFN